MIQLITKLLLTVGFLILVLRLTEIESKKINGTRRSQFDNTSTGDIPFEEIPPKEYEMYLCPKGFTFHKNNFPLCYFLTDPEEFPPACPFPFTYALQDMLKENIKEIQTIPIWVMIRRLTSPMVPNQFNPFHSMDADFFYNTEITKPYEVVKDITGSSCMIYQNGLYIPKSCNSKFQRICAYPYPSGKYCQTHYPNKKCISNSLDIENHACYCEDTTLTQTVDACEKLAEPLEGYQSKLLVDYFPSDYRECLFGLCIVEGLLKWCNSNKVVDYSYWADEPTESPKPFAVIRFKNNINIPYGWLLSNNDFSIKCRICEKLNIYGKQVSISLHYNVLSNNVTLKVRYDLELSDYFGQYYALYCFIGPTIKALQERYPPTPFGVVPENKQLAYSFINNWGYPVYFWCEGFQHPTMKPIFSKKILLQPTNDTAEYAIQVKVQTQQNIDPYFDKIHIKAYDQLHYAICSIVRPILRIMQIFNYNEDDSTIEMVLHLTTPAGVDDPNIELELLKSRLMQSGLQNAVIFEMLHVRRADFCLPSTTILGEKEITWPLTPIGDTVTTNEFCLQKNYNIPVTRKCHGSFLYGGYWSDVSSCCSETELSARAKKLKNLLDNTLLTPSEVSGNLSLITKEPENITVYEINLISKVLKKLEREEGVPTTDLVNTVSNIMHFDAERLRSGQNLLNSTDQILYSFDVILAKDVANYSVHHERKLQVQVSDVASSGITGVFVKRNVNNSMTIVPLYQNTTMENLLKETFEVATFLPKSVIEELTLCKVKGSQLSSIMSIFNDRVLFNEDENVHSQVTNAVMSILITNINCTINHPIPVVFKSVNGSTKKCAHWNYRLDDSMENHVKGQWKIDGEPVVSKNTSSYIICEFTHLTHFALLIMDPSENINDKDTKALDILTAIGSCLSLASIFIIIAIAAVNKKWRAHSSNKILLNFSVTLALQLILLFVAGDIVRENGFWCILSGAFLHYSILSEFCWMLVIAILQYRKFVIVFNKPMSRLVLKACAVCWGLPLIPVIILLSVSAESYKKTSHGLCYPNDHYFYFGLVMPIAVIVSINIFLFVRIMSSICCRRVQVYGPKENVIKLQVLLAFVLFFLLGISWIFGLASGFSGSIVFSYLFCITATLQGLVMFLFFVLMSESSSRFWIMFKKSSKLNSKRKSSNISITQVMSEPSKDIKTGAP